MNGGINEKWFLLGASATMMIAPVANDLDQLHDLFCDFDRTRHLPRSRSLVERIILHPQSQERLRSACSVVLKGWAKDPDLCQDVMQGATVLVTERLLRGPLSYRNDGPDQFGGWLWTVWYHACLRAWDKCRPLWMRNICLLDTHELAQLAAPSPTRDERMELWQAIEQLPEHLTRALLYDWAVGFSAAKSARLHRMSERTCLRLRKHALQELRAALR
jgi:DNA-directed RNA polymerase specialized sigma24 family protein